MTNQHYDAIVIGGGAAGLSAAQALGRALRRTLVIDAGEPRNRFAAHMHNLLGHDGAEPAALLARGRAEAERYGVEFLPGRVRSVREGGTVVGAVVGAAAPVVAPGGAALEVELESGATFTARALVVASGAADALPEIPGLAERWGSTVLHCPYCHGWEVRGRRIGVVTTSPLGLHQARLVRQWSDRVTVFSAGLGELAAADAAALVARGVTLVPEPVRAITAAAGGDGGGGGDGGAGAGGNAGETADGALAVVTADGRRHVVDAVFTASELRPHDGFLAPLALERAETPVGSCIAVDAMGRTSHPRVWAVGNVAQPMATVPVAAGAGTFAGAAVNAVLVDEDYAAAMERDHVA